MADKTTVRIIPKRELLAYRADFKLRAFRQIRKMFNLLKGREGFTQKDLAIALGIDEGLLSRRLSGKNDMRMETFSDLARALECKIEVELVHISEIERRAALERERMNTVPKIVFYGGGRISGEPVGQLAQSNSVVVPVQVTVA